RRRGRRLVPARHPGPARRRGLRHAAPGPRARAALPARGALRRLRSGHRGRARRARAGCRAAGGRLRAGLPEPAPPPGPARAGPRRGAAGADRAHELRGRDRQPGGGLGGARAGARAGCGRGRASGLRARLRWGGGDRPGAGGDRPAAGHRRRRPGGGRAHHGRHLLPLDPRPAGRTALARDTAGNGPAAGEEASMRVGVLGIGKTPHKIQHHKSLRDLIVEAGRKAMDDAAVAPGDIQALYLGNAASPGFNYEISVGLMAADHLGLTPSPAVRVEAACGTGAWALHLGCVSILSGLYDTVLVMGAEKMNDLATVEATSVIAQAADSKEEYFSGLTFPSGVALTARKYMQVYELSEEDLAWTAVKNHHYGARNPYAHLRFECTVEEVMRSA